MPSMAQRIGSVYTGARIGLQHGSDLLRQLSKEVPLRRCTQLVQYSRCSLYTVYTHHIHDASNHLSCGSWKCKHLLYFSVVQGQVNSAIQMYFIRVKKTVTCTSVYSISQSHITKRYSSYTIHNKLRYLFNYEVSYKLLMFSAESKLLRVYRPSCNPSSAVAYQLIP